MYTLDSKIKCAVTLVRFCGPVSQVCSDVRTTFQTKRFGGFFGQNLMSWYRNSSHVESYSNYCILHMKICQTLIKCVFIKMSQPKNGSKKSLWYQAAFCWLMHQICETNLNLLKNFSVVWNPVEMTGSCPWKFNKQAEYDHILRVKVWSHLQIFVKSRVYCQ